MQNLQQRQRGMTFIGWCLVLGILGFFVLMTLRLIPTYLEYFRVSGQTASLAEDSGSAKKSPAQLKKLLLRRFSIDDVVSVPKKNIKISKKREIITINIEYQVTTPLIGNIDALVSFKVHEEIQVR